MSQQFRHSTYSMSIILVSSSTFDRTTWYGKSDPELNLPALRGDLYTIPNILTLIMKGISKMTNRPAKKFSGEMIADSKEAAQIAPANIENDGETDDKDKQTHTLVLYTELQQSHGKYRAKVCEDYKFLCLANTRVWVGWLVCKHALVGRCEIESAVRQLDTKQRLTGPETQIDSHNKSVSLFKGPIVFGEHEMRLVADAAARASVLRHLLFSFAYCKPGK